MKHLALVYSSFFKNILFYFTCKIIFLNVSICTICVPVTFGDQKKILNFLELELQTFVIYHMGTENQIQVLCKSGSLYSPYFLPSFLLLSSFLPPSFLLFIIFFKILFKTATLCSPAGSEFPEIRPPLLAAN